MFDLVDCLLLRMPGLGTDSQTQQAPQTPDPSVRPLSCSVMVQSGRTGSLVAKYRPPMPIMAVVVPTLRSDALGWKLEGERGGWVGGWVGPPRQSRMEAPRQNSMKGTQPAC
jgi:hypothetical protein